VTNAIDWDVARRTATRVAKHEPFLSPTRLRELERSFVELTTEAEALVGAETGLPSLAGPARARVTDRAGWVDANMASFRRLLRPLTDKLEDKAARSVWSPVGRRVAGAEVGALLGWMSTRVLGQYDLLVIEDEAPEDQDLVYYVGPNLLTLERRYAFPSREFRLWIALHECTHRSQFTGVPWLRGYFLGLVNDLLASVEPDPSQLIEALKRTVGELRAGERPLDRGGLAAVLAGPAQREALDRVGGLMSLLEGHGEVVMNRAGLGRVPTAWRFEKVLKTRRASTSGPMRLLQRLIGLEAKMNQYAEGERFILAVETAGGRPLFDKVWTGPEWLPTLSEIRDPHRWIARARADSAA
jgi:coenzyme F420 biosynthesis associated uncharacterized protein